MEINNIKISLIRKQNDLIKLNNKNEIVVFQI
jgi:hypothetical protein